jgi:hypothetical protein
MCERCLRVLFDGFKVAPTTSDYMAGYSKRSYADDQEWHRFKSWRDAGGQLDKLHTGKCNAKQYCDKAQVWRHFCSSHQTVEATCDEHKIEYGNSHNVPVDAIVGVPYERERRTMAERRPRLVGDVLPVQPWAAAGVLADRSVGPVVRRLAMRGPARRDDRDPAQRRLRRAAEREAGERHRATRELVAVPMAKLMGVRERIDWATTLTFERLQPGERRLEAYLDPDVMEIDSSLVVQAVYTSGDVVACDFSLRCSDTVQLDEVPALHFDSALCESCEKQAARHPHALHRAILVPPRSVQPLIVEAHHVGMAKPATLRVMLRGLQSRDVDTGDPVGRCDHDDCRSAPWLGRACREERRRLRNQSWRQVAKWLVLEVIPTPRRGSDATATGLEVLYVWRSAVRIATSQLRAVTLDDVREASRDLAEPTADGSTYSLIVLEPPLCTAGLAGGPASAAAPGDDK